MLIKTMKQQDWGWIMYSDREWLKHGLMLTRRKWQTCPALSIISRKCWKLILDNIMCWKCFQEFNHSNTYLCSFSAVIVDICCSEIIPWGLETCWLKSYPRWKLVICKWAESDTSKMNLFCSRWFQPGVFICLCESFIYFCGCCASSVVSL